MWYIVLFAALLGADQLIKLWTVEHLASGGVGGVSAGDRAADPGA